MTWVKCLVAPKENKRSLDSLSIPTLRLRVGLWFPELSDSEEGGGVPRMLACDTWCLGSDTHQGSALVGEPGALQRNSLSRPDRCLVHGQGHKQGMAEGGL